MPKTKLCDPRSCRVSETVYVFEDYHHQKGGGYYVSAKPGNRLHGHCETTADGTIITALGRGRVVGVVEVPKGDPPNVRLVKRLRVESLHA